MSFDPVYLERTSRHAYSGPIAGFVRRFAGVRPGMCIVEMGCGTGFWGRLLAAGLRGRGHLVGLDRDAELVRLARRVPPPGGVAVEYRVGDACDTGLPDGSADVVTCHRLLTVVPDPRRVLAEMVRVAAPGGLVVVNEHDHSRQLFWEPDDPDLAPLRERGLAAQVAAVREVAGRDNALAARLPALLLACRLEHVKLLGLLVPQGPLPFDRSVPRREIAEHVRWLRDRTRHVDPPVASAAAAAGWSAADERDYQEREARVLTARLENPVSLRRWGRVTLVPRLLVRGRVPRSRPARLSPCAARAGRRA